MPFEPAPSSSHTGGDDRLEHLAHEYERLHAVAMLLNAELIEAKRDGDKSKIARLTRLHASIADERVEVAAAIRTCRELRADQTALIDESDQSDGSEMSLQEVNDEVDESSFAQSFPVQMAPLGGWTLRTSTEAHDPRTRSSWPGPPIRYAARALTNRVAVFALVGTVLVAGICAVAFLELPSSSANRQGASSAPASGVRRHAPPPRASTAPARSPSQSATGTQPTQPTTATSPVPSSATTAPPPLQRTGSSAPTSGVQPTTNTTYPPDKVSMSASPQYVAADGSTSLISIRVTTSSGVAVSGAPVTFGVSGGSCGSVSPASTTVESGAATTTYTAAGTTKNCTITVTETDSGQNPSFSWSSWASASMTLVNESVS